MKKPVLATLALAIAPLFVAAQPAQPLPPDAQTQAALRRLERRTIAAERQAKDAAASLQALKTELKTTTDRLESSSDDARKLAVKQAGELQGLAQTQASLGTRIGDEAQKTTTQVESLRGSIGMRTTAFTGLLGAAVLLLAALVWQQRRVGARALNSVGARIDEVARAARASEERAAKADTSIAGSLFEVLASMRAQLAAVEVATPDVVGQVKPAEPDHNLPSKVADEIHRMRKRLQTLPEETKGLTPLKKSLERLEAELVANGYEIIDHTGKAYSDNMSLKARFIPSEDLGPDERVISKVVVPQLNHQGVMVRMADVEVSIGS